MPKFSVYKTDYFLKQVKILSKRYKSIEYDIDKYLDTIETVESLGVPLGKNLYKVRLQNSDNNKGKSGGYRLITYLKITQQELTLVYIYSKSDLENVPENEIDKIILKNI